jgi:hypothetical protein
MKMRAALVLSLSLLLGSACLTACADENDPKTWVKRLDDPAQRAQALKRLDEMYQGAMSSANSNRDDPKVKGIIDDADEALTKVYTTQQLDEKTRKDLIKLIADMGDPRGAPAFAKAFKDYEPGKNDEDVKFAAQGTSTLSKQNKLTDQGLIDALWDCFSKFKPSQAKSINLVQDLAGAVKTVKHPSYGAKAAALIQNPIPDPKSVNDQRDYLQFWQMTSAQLIGDTKYTAGIPALVKVLMTPAKAALTLPVRTALMKMPKESEPELIKALKGEGDYAKLAESYEARGYLPLVAEPLAYISRPPGQAALLDQLAKPDLTPQNRVLLARDLTLYPPDPKLVTAYKDAYAKTPGDAAIAAMSGANAHVLLLEGSANLWDSSLTEWIVKEVNSAKTEPEAHQSGGLPAAIKLMTNDQSKIVNDAVNKISGPAVEKDKFKAANSVLDKCKKDSACYLSFLDTPIPSTPDTAKWGHYKAVWMAVELKDGSTKAKLLEKLDKIKDPDVRLDILLAIDALSPQGDAAAADKLDKLVAEAEKSGNKAGVDEMYRIALKLRSKIP